MVMMMLLMMRVVVMLVLVLVLHIMMPLVLVVLVVLLLLLLVGTRQLDHVGRVDAQIAASRHAGRRPKADHCRGGRPTGGQLLAHHPDERRLWLRGQSPAAPLQTVCAHALAHHPNLEALLVATVLAPVAPPLVHHTIH